MLVKYTSKILIGTVLDVALDANNQRIFDLGRIVFDELGSIPPSEFSRSLITSIFVPGGGNNGQEMIFNIPNLGFRNDFWKFFSGSFPNNPVAVIGRRITQFQTDNSGEFRVISNLINLDVFGVDAQVNIGAIGSNLTPFNDANAPPFLDLGETGQANDAEFWRTLFVKNIVFEGPNVEFTSIKFIGNNLEIKGGQNDDIIFTEHNSSEFFRCDGGVEHVIFAKEVEFNNDIASDIIPDVNNTFDLGSGAKKWEFIHGTSGVFNTVNASLVLTLDSGTFFLVDECSMNIDTVVGTKIGTGTNQKIGFWNSTPVVQQTVASDTLANLYTALRNNGIIG